MKVCDKCRKSIDKGNLMDLQSNKFEICDECASKIVQWIKQPIKKGFLGGLLNQ